MSRARLEGATKPSQAEPAGLAEPSRAETERNWLEPAPLRFNRFVRSGNHFSQYDFRNRFLAHRQIMLLIRRSGMHWPRTQLMSRQIINLSINALHVPNNASYEPIGAID